MGSLCRRFIDSTPRTKQTTKLSSFNLNQSVYEFGMRAIYDILFHSHFKFAETDDTSVARMRRHFNFPCARVPIHSGKRRRKKKKYKYNYAIYLQLDEQAATAVATATAVAVKTQYDERILFLRKIMIIFRVFL